jgi:hypothetical protein
MRFVPLFRGCFGDLWRCLGLFWVRLGVILTSAVEKDIDLGQAYTDWRSSQWNYFRTYYKVLTGTEKQAIFY